MSYKYGISKWDFKHMSIGEIVNAISQFWNNCAIDKEHNERIGDQIRELVNVRDGIGVWVLERAEIQDIIDFLCTE